MATTNDRIANIDKKIEQMKARKKALQSQARKKERSARNHRLIEIGAIVESCANCTINDLESFREFAYAHRSAIAETQSKNTETSVVESNNQDFQSYNN